MTTISLQYC